VRQVLKGVAAAVIVGILLGSYLHFMLHGTLLFTILVCVGLGLAILVVVGTRSDQAEAEADAAWLAAAPDLPPASDRRTMETAQRQMPGPTAPGRGAPADRGSRR
jgi:uncharacterized membrane protein YfcA